MTSPTLSRLAELAKAATPGPWRLGDWSATFGTMEVPRNMRVLERNATHQGAEPYKVGRADGRIAVLPYLEESPNETSEQDAANMAYIAAASPEVVLGLIERVRELEGGLGEALDLAEMPAKAWNDDIHPKRCDELRALLEKP